MGKLFKKFRIKQGREKEAVKPKIRKIQEISTHRREHSEIEKILYCLCASGRKQTGYRKIIDGEEGELEKNIFLVSERLMEVSVSFGVMDKLFYSALRKMLSLRNSAAIHKLISDYFLGCILCGAEYSELGLFLAKHAPGVFTHNRDGILSNIGSGELHKKILELKYRPYRSVKFQQKVLLLRSGIVTEEDVE